MKKYIVVTADDLTTLEIAVHNKIADGYLPLGGVSCSLSENDSYRYQMFCQAMVLPHLLDYSTVLSQTITTATAS